MEARDLGRGSVMSAQGLARAPRLLVHFWPVICKACKRRRHKSKPKSCPGGTWCACQHMPAQPQADEKMSDPTDC
jgi:hypothetical protein